MKKEKPSPSFVDGKPYPPQFLRAGYLRHARYDRPACEIADRYPVSLMTLKVDEYKTQIERS